MLWIETCITIIRSIVNGVETKVITIMFRMDSVWYSCDCY